MNKRDVVYISALSLLGGLVLGIRTQLKLERESRIRWIKLSDRLVSSGYIPIHVVQKAYEDFDFDMIVDLNQYKNIFRKGKTFV